MPLAPDQIIRAIVDMKRTRGLVKTQEDEDRAWDEAYEKWAALHPELPEQPVSSRKTTSDPEKGSI